MQSTSIDYILAVGIFFPQRVFPRQSLKKRSPFYYTQTVVFTTVP